MSGAAVSETYVTDPPHSFSVRVDSPPKVKGRPRLGRKRRVYTPAETLEAEAIIGMTWRHHDGPLFNGPVAVSIELDKLGQTITITEVDWKSKLRGDVDNYSKASLDGLNGIAYLDDKQVMSLTVTKR